MVQNLVRATLSLTFVIAAARVVFNVKARMTREATWQLELKGDLTKQRRVEAVDKLLSVLTLLVASVFGLQAIGLDGETQNTAVSGNPMPKVFQPSLHLQPMMRSRCRHEHPTLCMPPTILVCKEGVP